MNKKIVYAVYALLIVLFAGTAFAESIEYVLEQYNPVYFCGGAYKLEAIYISKGQVKFMLNNETSDTLKYHDLFKFKEGSSIYVREILEEEAKEGPDKVSIRFYPKTCMMKAEVAEKNIENITKEAAAASAGNATNATNQTMPAGEKTKEMSLLQRMINWIIGLFK